MIELTVPHEDRIDEAQERKRLKYQELVEKCQDKGWKAWCLPVEVGCRVFPAQSLWITLGMLGVTGKERKKHHKGDRGAGRKGIPVDLVQKKRAQKPARSKWDLIDPTGPLLDVVDVRRAETTVEGRDILMMGPVKCDKTSFKVVVFGIIDQTKHV